MLEINNLSDRFEQYFEKSLDAVFFSPGRVNLIGEHIDYNGGNVLPAAISMGISAAVKYNNTPTIHIYANNFKECFELDISKPIKIDAINISWKTYVLATLKVLQDMDIPLYGADIYIDSDLPIGSGLSSSAAFECIIAMIFAHNNFNNDRKSLAVAMQKAEKDYVGVNCGIMDQYAIANGKKDHAMLLDCATITHNYIPANFGNYQMLIINSNHPRTLANSKYNERRQECEIALEIINQILPTSNLIDTNVFTLDYISDDIIYSRALHVVSEHLRVLNAVQSLSCNNIEYFGQLLLESHQSLKDNYEVSSEALDFLVHYAMKSNRCIGARMTGAGFGGCCIALVEKGEEEQFSIFLKKKYKEKTGLNTDIFIADIVDGVKRIF